MLSSVKGSTSSGHTVIMSILIVEHKVTNKRAKKQKNFDFSERK
jgi:hypothetical protein